MITWDENKRALNLKYHGIDFADLESVFDYPLDSEEDRSANHFEMRLRSLGIYRDRVVMIVWIPIGDDARIISCRYGDKHETRKYYKTVLYPKAD